VNQYIANSMTKREHLWKLTLACSHKKVILTYLVGAYFVTINR